MTTTFNTIAIASLLLLPVGYTNATSGDSSFKVLVGDKSLDSDWENDDSMNTVGFMFTYIPPSLPVGVALDFYGSGNENNANGVKTEAAVGELNLGLRWQASTLADSFIPYLGGGISFVAAELQTLDSDSKTINDDHGSGYWVGGGVDYFLADHWSAGFDVHYSSVDLTLDDEVRDAGGFTWGATLGYHF